MGYNGHDSYKTDRKLNLQRGYFEAVEVEVYRGIYYIRIFKAVFKSKFTNK